MEGLYDTLCSECSSFIHRKIDWIKFHEGRTAVVYFMWSKDANPCSLPPNYLHFVGAEDTLSSLGESYPHFFM